jgi:FlaA1/EpsC-like NDP-sugar epimerase
MNTKSKRQMYKGFDLHQFIRDHLTGRQKHLLQADLSIYHQELSNRISGRAVLVIGGAGTIGSNFIKAILRFKVSKLYVVDINENGLTELVRDLRSSEGYHIPADFKTYPIDFGDTVFQKIFKNEGPFDIVANFAAHKHVRSEKDQYSIEAMIQNNVIKAKMLLDLLLEAPPECFFCVSTDKAANPVNVMGASKKLMEEVILAYSSKLHITTARFANVAFSNGSLPAGFLERLSKKQPLSSPSNILRFFVSPIEAGDICLMACIMGESGDIFFPKLDPEKDIRSFSMIAEQLLNTLGYQPDFCETEEEARKKALLLNEHSSTYPVFFFESDTSGEKPYEEFYTEGEELNLDSFPNLGVIKNAKRKKIEDMEPILREITNLFQNDKVAKGDIVAFLKELLPGFKHIETGKSLDQKM